MKQTFSFRRFGMLARKHYAENRINYFACLGGYLMFLLLGLLGALREDMPSLDRLETILIFVAFFTPIFVAKMSFAPYILPARQMEAFTLPATRDEKFIFAVVNTLLITSLAISGLEVTASLVAPRCAMWGDGIAVSRSVVGHWWGALTELMVVVPMFATTTIFACTTARKGHVVVPMLLVWGAIILLYLIPTALMDFGDGMSVATVNFPAFIYTFNNHIECGNTTLECVTEPLMQSRGWLCLIMPAVLLVVAWFKFREYETK